MARTKAEESCRVLMYGEPLGRLAKVGGGFYFQFDTDRYDPSPLKMPAVEKKTYRFQEASFGLPGLIRDYLPGRYGQAVIAKALKKPRPTEIESLLFIGDRGLGALSFQPDSHSESKSEILSILAAHMEAKKIMTDSPARIRRTFAKNSAIDGAKAKVVGGIDPGSQRIYIQGNRNDPLPEGFFYGILKINETHDDPPKTNRLFHEYSVDLVTEHIYNTLAASLGIGTMPTWIFREEGGACHFATQRFDRTAEEVWHSHTYAGLIHHDSAPFTMSYEYLMRTANALRCPREDLERIYRLMVFNHVFANCDDHSRNFSFLQDKNGEWRFAPAYDLTFSAEDYTFQNQLTILHTGQSGRVDADAAELARRFDIDGYLEIIERTEEVCRHRLPEELVKHALPDQWIDHVGKNVRGITADVRFSS